MDGIGSVIDGTASTGVKVRVLTTTFGTCVQYKLVANLILHQQIKNPSKIRGISVCRKSQALSWLN